MERLWQTVQGTPMLGVNYQRLVEQIYTPSKDTPMASTLISTSNFQKQETINVC